MKKIYFLLVAIMATSFSYSQNAGDIIITEVMQNPSAVTDANGEYFEVYNTTGAAIDMNGWVIKDEATASETHTIASSVVVPAMGYTVFGLNSDTMTNGGVTVNYVYSSVSLGNGSDGIILETGGGTEIDRVVWDNGSTFPDPNGASMNLNSANFNGTDNDSGANWCASTTALSGGDMGTPGAANETCGAPCLVTLTSHTATCDANTAGIDTYDIVLNYTGGNDGTTYNVSVSGGYTVDGTSNDPTSVANGMIIVNNVNEGDDVTITVTGGTCNLMRTITSPSCVASTCTGVGSIIITEIMKNPSAVADSAGEYFEVYNTTGAAIDMQGWIIKDEATASENHTITSSVIVPAMGYAVFGLNSDTMANGGVTVNYVYSGITLSNSSTDGLVLECSGTDIDTVIWDTTNFPNTAGTAMELASTAFNSTDNDTGSNWGNATSSLSGGDLGTPGGANDFTLSIANNIIEGFKIFPNPTKGEFISIVTANNSILSVEIFDLLGKKVISKQDVTNQLNISSLQSGIYVIKVTENNKSATKRLVVR